MSSPPTAFKSSGRIAPGMLTDSASIGSISGSKAIPLVRKPGEAGELEDRVTSDFMKLMDVIEDQRSHKVNDQIFRANYRKKNQQMGANQFSKSSFIQPASSPSKTNVLASASTFRTLTAQKLQRHTASTLSMRKNGQFLNERAGSINVTPSFVSVST